MKFVTPTSFVIRGLLTASLALASGLTGFGADDDSKPALVSTTGGGKAWVTLKDLKAAAEKGDPRAKGQLGEMLLRGDDIPQDPPRALDLLEQAARAGDAQAAFRLGMVLSTDDVIEPDRARALAYLRAAAVGGVTEAFRNVGVAYSTARGVKRDYAEALGWFILARKHDPGSTVDEELRTFLTKQRRPETIAAGEKRAAAIEGELAQTTVAKSLPPPAPFNYVAGTPQAPNAMTLPKDGSIPPVAMPPLPVISKAPTPVKLALPSGQRLMWSSVAQLEQEAREGKPESLAALGQVLLDGKLLSEDSLRAAEVLERGAKAGSADAAQLAADLYAKGTRITRDDAKAFAYTLQAAKGGVFTAAFNLGALYTTGRGTTVNYPEALAWLIVAKNFDRDPGSLKSVREYLQKTHPEQIAPAEKRAAEYIKQINAARDQLPNL